MAEVVSDETSRSPSASAEPAPFFRPAQRDIVVNQRHFGLAYLALAIGVGVAVGLGIVLIGRGSHHAASTAANVFTPTLTGELGAKQIARHVGHKYRLANGRELVAVVGERPNIQNAPLFNYLIRPHDARLQSDIDVLPVGNGIMYAMCGFGKNCGVSETGPTALLLKREALELAFVTFRSDAAVDTVTTLLPPSQQGSLAVVFQRSQLAQWIRQPLSNVLPERGPLKPGSVSDAEAQRIGLIEDAALYLYDAAQGGDGNAILRLDPLG
jgi:hypothetical protein